MRRVLKFAEFRSPSHQYARQRRSIRQVLLPLPEIQASLLRCLYFLFVRKILETRHARAGLRRRALPVADEGSVCWRSGRKNHGKAQARRFFRVTARGHSLPSAPAKNKSLEISLNRAVSRLFFLLYISQFPYGARSARLFLMLKTVFKLSNFSVKSNLSVPYIIKKASVYNIDE